MHISSTHAHKTAMLLRHHVPHVHKTTTALQERPLSAQADFGSGYRTLFWGRIHGWIFHHSARKRASFQQHIETHAGFVMFEEHLPNLR